MTHVCIMLKGLDENGQPHRCRQCGRTAAERDAKTKARQERQQKIIDDAKAKPLPTAKKFTRNQLKAIQEEVELMRFTAKTILKVCDNLEAKLGYKI